MSKFKLGQVVATPGVLDTIGFAGCDLAIRLHVNGFYGDICESDWALNEFAIEHGERIVSVYEHMFPRKVYVITERDRSVTTVLLATEY